MTDSEVIILAGGFGKRMQSDLPKALVPLAGKPLINYVIDSVKKSGISNTPIVVIGQKREQIVEALGDTVIYAVQEEQLGTGHAVGCAISDLKETTKTVVVLYADHPFVSSETIINLIKLREEKNTPLVIATVQLPNFDGWHSVFLSFGRIIRNTKGIITGIIESKDADEGQKKITEVNPAFFCFEKKWLVESLPKIQNNNAQGEYYLTDLVALAMEQQQNIYSISIDAKEALGTNSKEDIELASKI